MHVDSAN
jgi:hypothetical protein